ncbi:hypothetical protein LCI18_002484 [Fusarium solani-melongenae]|uniref:Uncharacterized protein n=1 Tax=Fusarium solani subsp. cucurbitae TaxID=2747967 RepID=A0ACD3YRE2_FUSSC|nr:hypothetical protein LCI18_002484 [Fusarium solani-melongenae]
MPALEYRPISALPLRVQSQEISFFEWVTLLTFCLTPLVAHVLVGVPSPTHLDGNRPTWHHRICHYNPTSILWRYAIIADRRIRARNWSKADLAATNALFWTGERWDGSEAMTKCTHQNCVHLPEDTRASFFSREMVKTLIVTFQGLQAITLLSGGLTEGAIGFTKWMAVDIIFFPIALIGLLRLFCCFWITDDFSYPSPNNVSPCRRSGNSTDNFSCSCRQPDSSGQSFERFSEDNRFLPTTYWGSILFRLVYGLSILGLLALTICYAISGGNYTATTFTVLLFYLVFLAATTIIFFIFFICKHEITTIIPCISETWYQIYTGCIISFAVIAIVIACLETRKSPCGKFTSGYGHDADVRACLGSVADAIPVSEEIGEPFFGLAAYGFTKKNNGSFVKVDDKQQVANFTGMCLGKLEL